MIFRARSAWRASIVLFILGAWPTWAVDLPPLQDLPNHLAAAVVQAHPSAYPEFSSNGFFKTNAALFLFLFCFGRLVGLKLAAKLFVTLTIAVGAWAYPRVIEKFAGREKVTSASLFLWPMVHNWFVAMGMLDYALAVPLAMETLIRLDAVRHVPSLRNTIIAAAFALLVWYAHVFAFVALALLVIIECLLAGHWKELAPKSALVRHWLPPLLPATALTFVSALAQLRSETRFGTLETIYQGALPLLYGAWAEWLWSLTKWTCASTLVAGVLAYFGFRRFRETYAFFSPTAFGVLVALYFLVPYHTHHWFYAGSRLLPFVWMACALRVPKELPRGLVAALAVAAASWSIGLGVEYVQIARDWRTLTRAEVAIPRGSRLLPLVFDRKGPHGDNTWPMLHAWGLFVVDLQTSAPLLFAHSRSFAVSYATEPEPRFHQLNLVELPQNLATKDAYCTKLVLVTAVDDCSAAYADAWRDFWDAAVPRFDRVLMVQPGPEVRAAIPAELTIVYDEGGVVVLAPRALGSW